MKRYVTFGQKYALQKHPTVPGAHPDGILEVEFRTDDYIEWRKRLIDVIGSFWAFDYDAEQISGDISLYPRGITHRLTEKGVTELKWQC